MMSNTPANDGNDFLGNMIRPFQLESSSIRGRIVRFNTVLQDILLPHDYPPKVKQLLGETITLCALLGSMMKFDGIFTLQISAKGPVTMLVADLTSAGAIRGCASFDREKIDAIKDVKALNDESHTQQLLGEGYITFTVDQGKNTERYQGIVELKGQSLIESVQHYFSQSEQINTSMKIAVGEQDNVWRSAGMILQQMPNDGGIDAPKPIEEATADDWNRSMILLQSCTEKELLSSQLNAHDILLRLFHEEGVRVFTPTPLIHKCRCSNEKVNNIFRMMTDEELNDMVVDGKIILTCEFCSKNYEFDEQDIKNKLSS